MIKILNDNQCIEIVFEKWILATKDFILEAQYKKSLMGFASILLVNPNEQNPTIISNLSQIYTQIYKLAEEINKRHQPRTEKVKEQTQEEMDAFLANVKNILSSLMENIMEKMKMKRIFSTAKRMRNGMSLNI
jgi:galactokinase/mevalonate kinase-like predicted kinase